MVLNASRQVGIHTVWVAAGFVYVASYRLKWSGARMVVDVVAARYPRFARLGRPFERSQTWGLRAIGMRHPRWRCPRPDWIRRSKNVFFEHS
jgi:hypothetical protein